MTLKRPLFFSLPSVPGEESAQRSGEFRFGQVRHEKKFPNTEQEVADSVLSGHVVGFADDACS